MTQTFETLLSTVCNSVEKLRENEQQTVYQLRDAKAAKLAYDVIVASGVDVKLFPDEDTDGAKIYVTNASMAPCEPALQSAMESAQMLRKIKNILDENAGFEYHLSFMQTTAGRQLTLQMPSEKPLIVTKAPAPIHTAANTAPTSPVTAPRPKRMAGKSEEEELLGRPAVARQAVPKFMLSQADGKEDPFFKRMLLYLSGRFFTSGSWFLLMIFVFGVIFSLAVMVKGFLCPDFVTDQQKNPSYCPKPKSEAQRAIEQQ